MGCTQLLIIVVDYDVIITIIIGLIKYPILSSRMLSAILLLYLECSVRAAFHLQVNITVELKLLTLLVPILYLVLFSFYPFLFFAPFCN